MPTSLFWDHSWGCRECRFTVTLSSGTPGHTAIPKKWVAGGGLTGLHLTYKDRRGFEFGTQLFKQFVLAFAEGEESPGSWQARSWAKISTVWLLPPPHSCSVNKPLRSSQLLKGWKSSSCPYKQQKMLLMLWIACRLLPWDRCELPVQ